MLGLTRLDGGLCGDVDFENVLAVAGVCLCRAVSAA